MSEKRAAATFIIELPRPCPSNQSDATGREPLEMELVMPAVNPPPRVLIIEDDVDFRDVLVEILEMNGFVAVTSSDGLAALEQLRTEEPPNVIMLDLMMPRMNGWQFRREQSQSPTIAGIPVIVMSADGHIRSKAAEIHADGYIVKPPEIAELLREVERVTSKQLASPAA